MPMVDLAFEILKSANTTFYYRDLMLEIAKIKGLSEDEMMQVIAQLYTEINIDGRFACVGGNMWGLKRWYPVEKSDDGGVGGTPRPRIINDDDFGDEEEEYVEEEEEETYVEEEDYDTFDEDSDFAEEEEEEEFFDEEEDLGEEDAEAEEDVDESEGAEDDFEYSDDEEDEEGK